MLSTVISVPDSEIEPLHNSSSGLAGVAAAGPTGAGPSSAAALYGDSSNIPCSQADGSSSEQPASTTAAQTEAAVTACESSHPRQQQRKGGPPGVAEAAVGNKLAAACGGKLQQKQSLVLGTLPQKEPHQQISGDPQAAATAGAGPQQQSKGAPSDQLPATKPASGRPRQADAKAVVEIAGSTAAATAAKLHREQRAMLLKIQELRASLSLSPSPVAGKWGGSGDDADE